jgi:hypothetical protein
MPLPPSAAHRTWRQPGHKDRKPFWADVSSESPRLLTSPHNALLFFSREVTFWICIFDALLTQLPPPPNSPRLHTRSTTYDEHTGGKPRLDVQPITLGTAASTTPRQFGTPRQAHYNGLNEFPRALLALAGSAMLEVSQLHGRDLYLW